MARDGAKKRSRPGGAVDGRPAEVRRIEDQLRKLLQTDVHITLSGKQKGELRVPFYSGDDFERMVDLLLGSHREAL